MKGKVVTVLGPVEPESLGLTLTHEHLLHDLKLSVFRQPIPDRIKHAENLPISLESLGYIRQYPYCFDENIEFSSNAVCAAVKEEMSYFKRNGGGAIVDNCSVGLRASNGHGKYLEELSKATGVKIVAGSGYYVAGSQSQSALNMTVESLSEKLREDLLVGMNGTKIKCGVIGEVGCSWPILDFEKKSLASTAVVQEETGAPVIIHPGRSSRAPEEIFRIFQEAGGKLGNTVMSHLDRTFVTKEDLLEFASLGSYCEFDLFGIEVSFYQLDDVTPMPSDAQRMESLRCLIQEGYEDRIVVAHDIHTKHRLMKYGGHGYSHILLNVVPLMKSFSSEAIHKILYTNPASWLTFR